MAQGEGTFGGNGSVDWKVSSPNGRANRTTAINQTKGHGHPDKGDQNDRWALAGVDETPSITGGSDTPKFTVSILLPTTLAAFVASARGKGLWVEFEIPILQGTPEQIKVTWPSEPK